MTCMGCSVFVLLWNGLEGVIQHSNRPQPDHRPSPQLAVSCHLFGILLLEVSMAQKPIDQEHLHGGGLLLSNTSYLALDLQINISADHLLSCVALVGHIVTGTPTS